MTHAYGQLTAPDTLVIERILPGPIERIWRYLTEPDLRRQWLAAGPMELRSGGNVDLEFHNDTLTTPDDRPPTKYANHGGIHHQQGTMLACEPPNLLRYTWPMGEGEPTEVQFSLQAQGDQVVLQVTHTRLAQRDHLLSVAGGWHVHLDIMAAKLKGEAVPPFWATHTRLEAEYDQRLVRST